MKNLAFLVAAAIACCLACTQNTPEKPAAPALPPTVRADIEKLNATYGERFFTNDPKFFEGRYTADACVFSPNLPAICGREQVQKFYYNDGKNGDIKINMVADEVFGSAENATEIGKYEILLPSGESVDKGKFMVAWRPENGVWKIYREIWNTDLPLPE